MTTKKAKNQPELSDTEPFELGTWNDLPQWRCKLCPWDTLDGEDAMMLHLADRHGPPPQPPKSVIIPVYDRWGNEIKEQE